MKARLGILAVVGVGVGCLIGYVLTRPPHRPMPARPTTSESTPGPTGPLPFAPQEPIACRMLPDGYLVVLYPAPPASASLLTAAPKDVKTNAIDVIPPDGSDERKAWVYIVMSEAEPEVTVSIPEGTTADSGTTSAAKEMEPGG